MYLGQLTIGKFIYDIVQRMKSSKLWIY